MDQHFLRKKAFTSRGLSISLFSVMLTCFKNVKIELTRVVFGEEEIDICVFQNLRGIRNQLVYTTSGVLVV